jgi:hypothetical protein
VFSGTALLILSLWLVWGVLPLNAQGLRSSPSPSSPIVLIPIDNIKQVSTGSYHTCAVITTGDLKCWGRNDQGQLGDATAWRTTPVDVMRAIELGNHLFLPALQQ